MGQNTVETKFLAFKLKACFQFGILILRILIEKKYWASVKVDTV